LNPGKYRPYLSEAVFQHLRQCALSLAEKQYFASAVWGAVFLEAFLSDLAGELGLHRPGQDDLNGRVQQIQQYSKNHSPAQPDIPDEIVKRCHDIRNARNRLVHHTGLAKKSLAQDAEFIQAGLEVIVEWYRTISPEKAAPGQVPSDPLGPGAPVFISTITPHHPQQVYFLEMFLSRLQGVGLQPVRLIPTVFDRADPIGKVRRTMQQCQAVIVLGLERSHAYFLRDKEGGDGEREDTHRKYTSGWLHLEAGIANALGLEVFVLCQKDICGDGIFDRSWNSYPVTELTSLDEDSPELGAFLGHLADWARMRVQPASPGTGPPPAPKKEFPLV
jgi:hypothetical protein